MIYNSIDTTDLIFHVSLQDHGIKGSSDFIEGSSLLFITKQPSVVAIGW